MRVKLRENIFHPWIIIRADNEYLAWSGSRWAPIDSDGLPTSAVQVLTFRTVKQALSAAESFGFEVEHG